MPGQKLGHGVT